MCLQRNHRATQLQHVLIDEILQRQTNAISGPEQAGAAPQGAAAGAPAAGPSVVVHEGADAHRQPGEGGGAAPPEAQGARVPGGAPGRPAAHGPAERTPPLQEEEEAQEEEEKVPGGRRRRRAVPQKTNTHEHSEVTD